VTAGQHRSVNGECGGVTVFVVIMATALLAMAAISVDGGYVLAARERAHSAAAQAARAGANAVSIDSVRAGGGDIDPAAAEDAARAVLATDGLTDPRNTVTVAGDEVTVSVTTTTNTVMLGIVGISTLTVNANAAARDVDGVTTVESS
jgi:Flp pilus assembly protein TadG